LTLCYAIVGEGDKSINQQDLQIIRGMQPDYFSVFPSTTPDLLSLTSGGRKNKRTELDNK